MHAGLVRTYILYVPSSYTPGTPAPLVLNFHGYTSNSFEQMNYGDFRPIADTAGFIIVHPMGTTDLLGTTHWNVGWGSSSVDDVGFTAALIDSLSAAYDINQERIYSTGMSNGGFMSYQLACKLSDRIAAIASVTGSMTIGTPSTCTPDHPTPVMEIHGTTDETVPYNGFILFQSIPSVLGYWSGYNNCDSPPVITNVPDTAPLDGSTVEHHLYANGDNGVEVEHYKVINGAHTWPGTAFSSAGTNHDIDASKEIWRFFSKYDINGRIGITSSATPSELVSTLIYPNPARSEITVDSRDDLYAEFLISAMTGQPMLTGTIQQSKQQVDVSSLPPGMYVLSMGYKTYKFAVVE